MTTEHTGALSAEINFHPLVRTVADEFVGACWHISRRLENGVPCMEVAVTGRTIDAKIIVTKSLSARCEFSRR